MGAEIAKPPGRPEIVTAAKLTWEAAKGKKYLWGGHDTNGFDCSGFVIYVLKQAYPGRGFTNLTASQLFTDRRFSDVTEGGPQFGDLICFKKQAGLGFDHIGLVYDIQHWIGCQSSTGVAPVAFSQIWWSKRSHSFRRLVS